MYHCKEKIFYVEWTSLKCRCSCNKILIYAFRKFFFVQLFHFVFKMILPRINLTFITWHLFKYLRRNCRLLKLEILFSIFTLFAFVRRRILLTGMQSFPSKFKLLLCYFSWEVCELLYLTNWHFWCRSLSLLLWGFDTVCHELCDLRSLYALHHLMWEFFFCNFFFNLVIIIIC